MRNSKNEIITVSWTDEYVDERSGKLIVKEYHNHIVNSEKELKENTVVKQFFEADPNMPSQQDMEKWKVDIWRLRSSTEGRSLVIMAEGKNFP